MAKTKDGLWSGWISGLKSSEQVLKDIGVELGEWEPIDEGSDYGTWEKCTVTQSVMNQLDPMWGTLIWELHWEES